MNQKEFLNELEEVGKSVFKDRYTFCSLNTTVIKHDYTGTNPYTINHRLEVHIKDGENTYRCIEGSYSGDLDNIMLSKIKQKAIDENI